MAVAGVAPAGGTQWFLTPAAPSEVAEHRGQVHFRVPGLETAPKRGCEQALRLGLAHRLGKEVGIATEVVGWRERDRVDALLDHGMPGGRERGDPLRERADEVAELLRGQMPD